jgi:hypothetical protein
MATAYVQDQSGGNNTRKTKLEQVLCLERRIFC